jgi:hypothetical protein
MKKIKIAITHQVEKTNHYFTVGNPDNLTSSEVDRIKKVMCVEMELIII